MTERKTYSFHWSAAGVIDVRGNNPEDAEENALDAIRNLATMDAGIVNVKQVNIND